MAATARGYTLSLHYALPISWAPGNTAAPGPARALGRPQTPHTAQSNPLAAWRRPCAVSEVVLKRSEEHTSELQSRFDSVCRLLLEKKNLRACDLISLPSSQA